jgi:hypothetical protein
MSLQKVTNAPKESKTAVVVFIDRSERANKQNWTKKDNSFIW